MRDRAERESNERERESREEELEGETKIARERVTLSAVKVQRGGENREQSFFYFF